MKTDEVLGEIFSSLPMIRQFEGKDYSSKKDAFKDLAEEWALSYEGKERKSKGRVVQVACGPLFHMLLFFFSRSGACASSSSSSFSLLFLLLTHPTPPMLSLSCAPPPHPAPRILLLSSSHHLWISRLDRRLNAGRRPERDGMESRDVSGQHRSFSVSHLMCGGRV